MRHLWTTNKANCILSIILLGLGIALLIGFYVMFDVLRMLDSLGASIIAGLLGYCGMFLYVLFAIILIIRDVVTIKKTRLFALIHVSLIGLTVFANLILPYTAVFELAFFTLQRTQLEETVLLYNRGQLTQVDSDEFIAPFRFTSLTGTIYIDESPNGPAIEFCIY